MPNVEKSKKFRTSWKVKICLICLLLGVSALVYWRVSVIGDTWIAFTLALPLYGLFGGLLKEWLQKGIILSENELVYYDGRKRKSLRLEKICKMHFLLIAIFDHGVSKFLFVTLDYEFEDDNRREFQDEMSRAGITEPDKTIVLDVTPFEINTIANLLLCLSRQLPRHKAITLSLPEYYEDELYTAVTALGGKVHNNMILGTQKKSL